MSEALIGLLHLVALTRRAIRQWRPAMQSAVLDPEPRVTCRRCAHYQPQDFRCANHREAGLTSDEISPALAELLQRCPGFETRDDSVQRYEELDRPAPATRQACPQTEGNPWAR